MEFRFTSALRILKGVVVSFDCVITVINISVEGYGSQRSLQIPIFPEILAAFIDYEATRRSVYYQTRQSSIFRSSCPVDYKI